MTEPFMLPVLTYHSVASETTPEFASLTVEPGLFAEHMAALKEQDVDIICFGDVPAALATGRPAVAITFDDGFVDFAEHACPVLSRLKMPATLFIPAGFVGRRASWLRGRDAERLILGTRDIADLARHGFEIGSHGRMHLAADINPAQLVSSDALSSRMELEQMIAAPVTSFAYPFGYHSAQGRRAIRAAGFQQACALGDLPACLEDDRWALPRLQVFDQTTPEALIALVSESPTPTARAVALGKQRIWSLGRRWVPLGPPESGRVSAVRA